jgi:hypothetical protein
MQGLQPSFHRQSRRQTARKWNEQRRKMPALSTQEKEIKLTNTYTFMQYKNVNPFQEKYSVKRCNKESLQKGLGVTVRAITKNNPYFGYTSGYLITDQEGNSHRWQRLDDLHENCIKEGRKIDGFARF